MSVRTAASNLVREFRSRRTPRAGSLIMTVYGDAIAPRGGTVWVGSLIRVMSDFGISERLVRTSVFRLAGDGWLEARAVGRRSYYGLTREGAARFEQATQRIYGEPRDRWSGDWCLVLLSGLSPEQRESLRKALGWLGFGAIGGSLLVHAGPDARALDAALAKEGAADDVVVVTGRTGDVGQDRQMRALAQKSWDLDEIDRRYRAFLDRFRPAFRAVEKSRSLDVRLAFQIRTLLIQEYRRILLRDPQLPADLLPDDWHGLAAYRLCRNLYRRIHVAADEYLNASMETAEGPLPPPGPAFYARFGGLDRGETR
jgi:phenylacetic acid degradation operon negative regulatory protein